MTHALVASSFCIANIRASFWRGRLLAGRVIRCRCPAQLELLEREAGLADHSRPQRLQPQLMRCIGNRAVRLELWSSNTLDERLAGRAARTNV